MRPVGTWPTTWSRISLVAVEENRIVGFLVARTVAADEREILNLAVVPDFRRKGVARALLDSTLRAFRGAFF